MDAYCIHFRHSLSSRFRNSRLNFRNVWREGDWGFLRKLRQALGNNHLITCDGQHEENQQAVGVLDGIESEGLVQHNDGFRGFSRTVNTHLYWQQNSAREHDFRYVVLKLMDKNDEARGMFAKFLSAVAGVSVDTSAEAKLMLIWPKSPSGSESETVKEARRDGFLIADFEPSYLFRAL